MKRHNKKTAWIKIICLFVLLIYRRIKEMIKIIKKKGSLEDFDENKIKVAITKSAERVMVTLSEDEKNQVVKEVLSSIEDSSNIPILTMHNLVETALDKVNEKVAKSYREYRDNKASFARMLDKVYNKKLGLNFIGDRSNANADSAIITTQRAIVYNELNSELYKKFFLTIEEEKVMSEGYIYIHDRGSRLDSFNCCLADVKEILTGGFEMGNLHYNEPKTLDVAFDLIGDIVMNMASCQYGGYTISEIDKLLAPYAQKSYDKYVREYKDIAVQNKSSLTHEDIEKLADEYAMKKVTRDFEQGWQGIEMKLNSVGSSRGDYPFTAVSFGLGTGKFETLCSSVAMKVRKEGQGQDGFKHPVLFPKLSLLYDENLHGEGKELEWLFLEAIDCSSKAMYPDYISCTGDGYCGDIYKKYHKTISRMGCRATLAPWYVRGGFTPADDKDEPVFEGRMNMGAISIHFPMIIQKAKNIYSEEIIKNGKDKARTLDEVFFDELKYYCDIIRGIHRRTFETFSRKKAGTNPLAFCQGGIYGGHMNPEDQIGREFLRPMTATFGITALNETQYIYNGKSLVQDHDFALRILKWMHEYKIRATQEDKILYALYATPAESLCGLQVEQFRKMFGEVKGMTDKPYTSNSFHCAVYEDITPIQKQDIEYDMYHYCTGGAIQYCRYPLGYNIESMIKLVRRGMKMGFYEGVNLQLDYCEDCGHQFIDSDTCPKCGSGNLTRIERMNGYLGYSRVKGRTMYADHKLAEFKDRKSM